MQGGLDCHFSQLLNEVEETKQAGAVLGQAQLKLELDFTLINLY